MSRLSAALPPCRSVFRENAAATTSEKYTQRWITLINRMERDRQVLGKTK